MTRLGWDVTVVTRGVFRWVSTFIEEGSGAGGMGQWGHYHLVSFFVCCTCLLLPYSICCDWSGPVTTSFTAFHSAMQLATKKFLSQHNWQPKSSPVAGFVRSWQLDFKTLFEMPEGDPLRIVQGLVWVFVSVYYMPMVRRDCDCMFSDPFGLLNC